MTANPKIHRVYDFEIAPEPWRAEIHHYHCACDVCAIAHPADHRVAPRLTFFELGWLALAGVVVGSAIAFAIDAHGAWHALASCFGGR